MKVGQQVRLLSEFFGVPGGTLGKVVAVEVNGSLCRVQWEIPGRDSKKPVVHLFTIEEYQKFLQPI